MPPINKTMDDINADLPEFAPGSVWLVGAGPGAPGLLTLLAYHALKQADVIMYDALVNPGILEMTRPNAEKIIAGKRGGRPSARQRDISNQLVEHARLGKRVLRLKGGDPLVFGRGGEECETLIRGNIPYRIVPGITAGIGGLAYAGIPVTHRVTNHVVTFLTGHDSSGDVPAINWQGIATGSQVIVIYMAVRQLLPISRLLLANGRNGDEPVALVSNATLPNQSHLLMTLDTVEETLAAHDVPTPAIAVVGPVADYTDMLGWYNEEMRSNPHG